MGWTAPERHLCAKLGAVEGIERKEPSAMKISAKAAPTTIGLDIAKNVFQVHAVDDAGQVVLRRKLSRGEVLRFFEAQPKTLVGIEACGTGHYWAREIAALGHEVASHGYHHELVYTLTPTQFREDVRRAKQAIEDAAGCVVRGYRAPSFTVTKASLWALDVLIEEGHEYDASIFPIHHDRYGMPGAPRHPHLIDRAAGRIVEVPGSTVRLMGANLPIAGGGYFRLLPYAWTRWGIHHVNQNDRQPVTFYLHPWEIDPAQPRFEVSRATALRHYTGLGATRARLSRLMTDFRFHSISSMLALHTATTRSQAPGLVYAR